jgi:16S rRNA G966 N2-methylase RsmD
MAECRTNGTFLELGAGDGRNLVEAAERGMMESIGYEIDSTLVAAARVRAALTRG